MPRRPREIWDSRGWRKAVAVLGAAYCVVAWVLPVLVMAVFRDLPYLEQHSFAERLLASAIGTALLVLAMVAAFPRRVRIYRGATTRDTVTNASMALVGVAMFTAVAAWWSGNTLGAIAKVLPGSHYSARFTVLDYDNPVGRRRSVQLMLQPEGSRQEVHLALSKWLFDPPEVREGDALVLIGKETLVGVYVERFRPE